VKPGVVGPRRGCSAMAADCVSYGDSAPTAARRAVPRRHKSSFYTDLRRVAGGDPDRERRPATAPPSSGVARRRHTRGVQRLNTAKRQRSLYKRSACRTTSFISARCNIYISRLCYDVSVRLSVSLSVSLSSVTEVHWRIIANLGFKF